MKYITCDYHHVRIASQLFSKMSIYLDIVKKLSKKETNLPDPN